MTLTLSTSKNPLGFEKLSGFQSHKKYSQFCIGIDPPLEPTSCLFFQTEIEKKGVCDFLKNYSFSLIEACAQHAASVKFQSAFFEAWGNDGLLALESGIQFAKQRSLFTILDAKRGDISSTMQAYGKTCFEVFKADSMTVLPYMGEDSIEAIVPWLKEGKTCYVVLLSSNPSGKNLQSIRTDSNSYVWEKLFDAVHSFAQKQNIEKNIGFVIGATQSLQILNKDIILENLKTYPWLIPGVGAQGSSFREIKNTLNLNPLNLAPVSRSLTIQANINPEFKNWDQFKEFVRENFELLHS